MESKKELEFLKGQLIKVDEELVKINQIKKNLEERIINLENFIYCEVCSVCNDTVPVRNMVVCCFNGHPCCKNHASMLSSGAGFLTYDIYVCEEHYEQVDSTSDDDFKLKNEFMYYHPYDLGQESYKKIVLF